MSQEDKAHLEVSGAIAQEGSVAAGAGGLAIGRDVYGPVVIAGEGAQVTVTVQGENLRDRELAYLDGLLKRYEYWRDHYTPLAGIAVPRPGGPVLRRYRVRRRLQG